MALFERAAADTLALTDQVTRMGIKVRMHAPLSTVHVDRVDLKGAGGTPDPYICDRVPPPAIPAALETADEPFDITAGQVLAVKLSMVPVRSVAGSASDTISRSTRVMHLANGGFVAGEKDCILRVQASAGAVNNADYTVDTVVGAADIIVGQEPRENEGPVDFLGARGVLLDATQTHIITFAAGDFPDMANVTAAQLADRINAEAIPYLHATLTQDSRRVRLSAVNPSAETLSLYAADGIAVPGAAVLDPDTTLEDADLGFTGSSSAQPYVALKDEDISFSIVSAEDNPQFSHVWVWAWLNGTETLILQATPGAVETIAAGWSVVQSTASSPSALNPDIWNITLSHSGAFYSGNKILVRIRAARLADTAYTDAQHEFVVEDWLRPHVEGIIPWTRRKLRIEFSEAMEHSSQSLTSALYVRDVSGRVSYYASYNLGTEAAPNWVNNVVEAPVASFTADDVGAFLGSRGAKHALNNDNFTILQRLSSSLVQVDKNLVDETAADPTKDTPPTLTVSPYRVVGVPAAGTIQPIYCPIVTTAKAVDPLIIPPHENTARYVMLEFADELSPSVTYNLEVVKICDEDGNLISSTYPLTSWQPASVPGRDFDVWTMIPQKNRDEDGSQDLERFIRCIDEVTQVLLSDVDRFSDILDPMRMPTAFIDVMLEHLGNKLAFVSGLTEQKKRDLIPLLVPMYKRRGTAPGIETAIAFFIGKTVKVLPWEIPTHTWKLGKSYLGRNTYLGPSRSFVRYSFHIGHYETLTTDEQSIIMEIVSFMRPAHTHFIGFTLLAS